MTREEARKAVEAHLGIGSSADPEVAILEDSTLERDFGWVFFYQSTEFIRSGDYADSLAGNAALIVDRTTGELFETGTAHPTGEYIRNYEFSGNPHDPPGSSLEIYRANSSANRVEASRLLSKACSVGVAQAMRGLDGVTAGCAYSIAAGSSDLAREICEALARLGFDARQLPRSAA